jgi:hypothetical protein
MSSFQIDATPITPAVHLDERAHRLVLEGDCYPENPVAFFEPIFGALEDHLATARPAAFGADFRLRYVNSASTVALHRLFSVLDLATEAGTRVRITWVHDPEDDVNEELGQDLSSGCHHAEFDQQAVPA